MILYYRKQIVVTVWSTELKTFSYLEIKPLQLSSPGYLSTNII